ncbi:Pycsar system effector family protein [Deminuibacter soli]|uniref:HD domain-containing protein n=1 Tax=Deminuibacter soli TaxID=2291815 RepID=A0A3E1NLW9_9BACT|nr:Pycsar system effector family protein [Deminuibacter soli]RFM28929.1 HD domain-containing protein [Deminuibacter soli]
MNYQKLLQEVEKYVSDFYFDHHNPKVLYHNQDHTNYVVNAAIQIANHYQLDDKDFFTVVAAAYFHDLGYFSNNGNDIATHETRGAGIAEAFLTQKEVDPAVVDQVKKCILATHMPQQPNGLLEEIVCDADLFHLGTGDFPAKNKLLRKEIEAIREVELTKDEWRKKNIAFLQAHTYFTDYCQLLLGHAQQETLEKLMKKEAEHEADDAEENDKVTAEKTGKHNGNGNGKDKDKKQATGNKKQPKDNKPERGIETMFRISSNNHQRLSDMADNKAHILITVNSIILSVLLSMLLRKLEDYPHLTIPAMLLLTVCVSTMVLSILSTRPKIPAGTFTQEDIDKRQVNLLFFGNFYKMQLEEYTKGLQAVMNDKDFLYDNLTRDVYAQGVVLGKKYKLLRIAYNIFMFGLIASVLAFAIATTVYAQVVTK